MALFVVSPLCTVTSYFPFVVIFLLRLLCVTQMHEEQCNCIISPVGPPSYNQHMEINAFINTLPNALRCSHTHSVCFPPRNTFTLQMSGYAASIILSNEYPHCGEKTHYMWIVKQSGEQKVLIKTADDLSY